MLGTSSIADYFHGIGMIPNFHLPVKSKEGEPAYFLLQDLLFEKCFLTQCPVVVGKASICNTG